MSGLNVSGNAGRRGRAGLLCAAAAALGLLAAGEARAASADGAGALRIGLSYVPQWGPETTRVFTEEGFEAELAGEIGAALGRAVELVAIPDGEQEAALASRRADALITGAAIASSRFTGAGQAQGSAQVLETAYRSGLNVAMPTFTTIRNWNDLAGKVVCVSEANTRALALIESLGATAKVSRAPALALIDLRTGACDASIHDQAVLSGLLATDEWRKFSSTLTPADPSALVVKVADADDTLARDIRLALADIDVAEKWDRRRAQWVSDVAFEVYLNQVGNDCH